MAWEAQNRLEAEAAGAGELLSKKLKDKIAALFEDYPSKRAALLPSLHMVQDELGYLPDQAMVEIAELLELGKAAKSKWLRIVIDNCCTCLSIFLYEKQVPSKYVIYFRSEINRLGYMYGMSTRM